MGIFFKNPKGKKSKGSDGEPVLGDNGKWVDRPNYYDQGNPAYDDLRGRATPGLNDFTSTMPTENTALALQRAQRARNFGQAVGASQAQAAVSGGAFGNTRAALLGGGNMQAQAARQAMMAADDIYGQDVQDQLRNNQFNAGQQLATEELIRRSLLDQAGLLQDKYRDQSRLWMEAEMANTGLYREDQQKKKIAGLLDQLEQLQSAGGSADYQTAYKVSNMIQQIMAELEAYGFSFGRGGGGNNTATPGETGSGTIFPEDSKPNRGAQ